MQTAVSHFVKPRSLSRLALILALVGCLLAPEGLPAQARNGAKAHLVLEVGRTAYRAGETAEIAALLAIEPGWHVNSHEPTFEYLIGTEVTFYPPEGWPAAAVAYPPGRIQSFSFSEEPLSVYDDQVVILGRLPVPIGAEEGTFAVRADLRYQACDDRRCLPPTTTSAAAEIRVGTGGRDRELPVSFEGRPESGGAKSLPLMLLLGLVGGLILNAMPCVLPVLSLKVFGLVKSAGRGRGQVVGGALATAAGILLSFWGLALAAVLAKAAGSAVGWGVQFQNPVFVTFLALVVALFCLNLWGLFEIPLPSRLARLGGTGAREGVPGHLASGLFATLMATPCSAPFLGTAVGFALSQAAPVIVAVFTAVGLGMALPYLLLAVAPGAARLLPKPGPWMETFRVVMGFLLAGALVWLFYVLAGQVRAELLAAIELTILLLALFVWLRSRAGSSPVRRLALVGIAVALVGSLVLAAGGESRAPGTGAPEAGLLSWKPFDEARIDQLLAEGRTVFVAVPSDWCITCKFNESLVLETEEVAAAFSSRKVVAMKADWTNRDPTIEAFLGRFGRSSVPTYVLFRPGRDARLFPELITKEMVLDSLGAEDGVS